MLSPGISLSDHVSTLVGQARSRSNEMSGYRSDNLKHIQKSKQFPPLFSDLFYKRDFNESEKNGKAQARLEKMTPPPPPNLTTVIACS